MGVSPRRFRHIKRHGRNTFEIPQSLLIVFRGAISLFLQEGGKRRGIQNLAALLSAVAPFPLASLPIVATDTAPYHFVTMNAIEAAAAKANRAKACHDYKLRVLRYGTS
ncbi:MAG: hypothetical protein WCD69_24005, partial [Xanthobacteraceae bacterium]